MDTGSEHHTQLTQGQRLPETEAAEGFLNHSSRTAVLHKKLKVFVLLNGLFVGVEDLHCDNLSVVVPP